MTNKMFIKINICAFSLLLIFGSEYFQFYVTSASQLKPFYSKSAACEDNEIWGPILENYILSNHREARVTQLIPIQSFIYGNNTTESADKNDEIEKESKISSAIKIVNNSNPSKKPSRQISETEMYMLNALEKLVYKMDFMEKRLRRIEEMLYYSMAGNKIDQEPCPDSFNRIGMNCYLFAGTAGRELDWKAANKQCKKFGAYLLELETIDDNLEMIRYVNNLEHLRGREYWTGGLNPGLLWIWSNSAKPIKVPAIGQKQNLSDPTGAIGGNGRCLRLSYSISSKSYLYRGSDCTSRYSYICQLAENSASNELRKYGKSKQILN